MTKQILSILLPFALLLLAGCQTDYDIADVAPGEHLESGGHSDHHEDAVTGHGEEPDVEHHMEDLHAGHAHGAGGRNHGTQWFFNQPWAAPFIWNKLLRDALIFLALAVSIFLITARKWKK